MSLGLTYPSYISGSTNAVDYTQSKVFSLSPTLTGTTDGLTYSYSYTGTLPAGLTLSTTTGLISGTPTESTNRQISVTVTESSTGTTATFGISFLKQSAMTLTGYSASYQATTGAAFSTTTVPTVYGGKTGAKTFALVSGYALPAGLTLDASTGAISGTPTVPGTFTFKIQVSDTSYPTPLTTSSGTISFTVSDPMTISYIQKKYRGKIGSTITVSSPTTTGGSGSKTYSMTNAPGGLTISTTTGAISGSVTTEVTDLTTVTVADSYSRSATTTLDFRVLNAIMVSYV